MIIQGFSNIASTYSSATKTPTLRQSETAAPANYADKVSISDAAKALMANAQPSTQERTIQNRLDAIKVKPALERTTEETDYISENDKRFAEIQDKIKANGFESLTSAEVDYMQKATGFVNTMAELSPNEKALFDELVAKGNGKAAQGLLLVGMARIGMGGQQVTLPNGRVFDPKNTEVTADSVRNLFKFMFVDPNGNTDRQFEALASCLDQRQASNQATSKA